MSESQKVEGVVFCETAKCRKVFPERLAVCKPPLCPDCYRRERDKPSKAELHRRLRELIASEERMSQ